MLELFSKVASLCDTIEEAGLWKKPLDITISLRDVLKTDIGSFILYLSASDGHLSNEEVQAFRIITGFGGDDTDSLRQAIKKNNIYSMEFESEPPLILKLLSQAEREAMWRGVDLDSSVLRPVAFLFKLVGRIIVSIDGGITYSEKRDLNIISGTIDAFVEEHDIVGNSYSLFDD